MGSSKFNLTQRKNNTFSGHPNPLQFTHFERYFQVTFSVILIIVIVVGNILVMAAYKKNRRLRTTTYTLLVSLALCDFLVGSLSVPLWICMSLRNWRAPSRWFDTFYLTIDYFTALCSALHLTAICLERWLAISKPFRHQTVTSKQYYLLLACVWMVALVVSLLVLIPSVKGKQTYVLVLAIVGFVLPILIISLVNVYIFKVAKKLIQQEPRTLDGPHSGEEERRKLQKERRTAKTLVIITALFFICLLPTYVLAFIGGFCLRGCIYRMKWGQIKRLMDFAKWMQYSNSAVNPFIYAFRDPEMRKTFKRISTRAVKVNNPVENNALPTSNVVSRL